MRKGGHNDPDRETISKIKSTQEPLLGLSQTGTERPLGGRKGVLS